MTTPILPRVWLLLALAPVGLAGCALCHDEPGVVRHRADLPRAKKVTTGSVNPAANPQLASDEMWRLWCENRYREHAAGQTPGDARSLEEKRHGDAYCASKGIGATKP